MCFKTIVFSALLALGTAANPVVSRANVRTCPIITGAVIDIGGQPAAPFLFLQCVVLSPGQYTISSAETGWELRPFHHAFAAPAIDSHQAAPSGQLGVWSLTNAPQAAYYISNVGENSVVSTLNFGGAPQPFTTSDGGAVAFAIQCAGNGTYVIKNPVADGVWTAVPDASVKILGANGDITQRFLFKTV